MSYDNECAIIVFHNVITFALYKKIKIIISIAWSAH